MNHSLKKIIIAIFLSVVVFVGGSLSALAKPPVRVNVYGVVYGSGGNSSWYQVQVLPVQNNIFGLFSPDPTLELVTQIAFYFHIDADSFTSFSLSLKKLSTSLQDNTSLTLNNVDIACYSGIGPNTGYYSLQNKTQTARTLNSDGTTDYTWTFVSSTGEISAKPYIKVIIPLQNFLMSSTPFYFELTNFFVDGEETVFSGYEQGVLTALEGIDQALNDDSDLPIDTGDIPSAPDTSSINSGTQTGIGYINDFVDEFATGGAVGRVLLPISTYLTVADSFNDNSTGHRMITIIFKLGCGLVIIGFIINGIKRRGDFT